MLQVKRSFLPSIIFCTVIVSLTLAIKAQDTKIHTLSSISPTVSARSQSKDQQIRVQNEHSTHNAPASKAQVKKDKNIALSNAQSKNGKIVQKKSKDMKDVNKETENNKQKTTDKSAPPLTPQELTKSYVPTYPKFQKQARKVFDCLPYNGEDHFLALRFLVMDSFVDYYVISQGTYTYTGQKKQLVFNISKFPKYAKKIIYITVSDYPKTGPNLKNSDHWQNNHYHRNSVVKTLNQLAKDGDIIFASDADQILSKQGFSQFNPNIHKWALTELRLYYYYFNRMSVYDHNERQQLPNYWLNGLRITTFKVFKQFFKSNMITLRRGYGCNVDVPSKFSQTDKIICQGPVIRLAGWHFSYVMNDKDVLKKLRSIADTQPDTKIPSFTAQRTVSPPPYAYLKDVELLNADLPIQLVLDVIEKKNESIYYQYFIEVEPNQKCEEGYIEKGVQNNSYMNKKRIVLNIRDADDKVRKQKLKKMKPIQCIKQQDLQGYTKNNQVNVLSHDKNKAQSNENQANQKEHLRDTVNTKQVKQKQNKQQTNIEIQKNLVQMINFQIKIILGILILIILIAIPTWVVFIQKKDEQQQKFSLSFQSPQNNTQSLIHQNYSIRQQ